MRLMLLIALCAPASGLAQEAPRSPKGEVEFDSLVLAFDQPMVTWATHAQTPPIRVSPALDCSWTWRDDTHLACEAMDGGRTVRLATRYRVEVGKGLWTQSGMAFPAQVVEMESERPSLDLKAQAWRLGRPELLLQSGHRLEEADVRAVLSLKVDGRPVGFRLELAHDSDRYGPARQWGLVPDWPAQGRDLVVDLAPGLRAPDGPLRSSESRRWTFLIDEPFEFAGVACSRWDFDSERLPVQPDKPCAPEGPLVLLFSSAPDVGSLRQLAAMLPEGLERQPGADWCQSCSREARAPLFAVAVRAKEAGRVFEFALPSDLRDTRGQSLRPARVSLPVADFKPTVRLRQDPWLVPPGEPPVAGASGINLPARARWVDLVVDRRVRLVETPLAPGAARNQEVPLAIPSLPRSLARRGGYVLSGLRGHLDRTQSIGMAPFHALVRRSPVRDGLPASVMAWATEWKGATPVPDLRGDWLAIAPDGQVQVLSSARGDADGVVAFPPATLTPAQRENLQVVRLRSGSRWVVLPLDPMTGLRGEDGSRPGRDEVADGAWSWAGARDRVTFGVTDRLLYRPGDIVRYRVWPRQRDDARLQAPRESAPLTLELAVTGWGEQPVATWTADADAWGSASGERRLPATLEDGRYCIAQEDADNRWNAIPEGACFQVARFDSQALWASLATVSPRVLRVGDQLAMDAESGFYSGGSGAQLPVSWLGLAEAVSFTEAYPDYSKYTFHYPEDWEGDPLRGLTLPRAFDDQGRAVLQLPAATALENGDDDGDTPAPFVRVRINATVGLPGQAQAASPTAEAFVAAHARYVGLRVSSGWLHTQADPTLEAVVVGHDGTALPGVAVDVVIRKREEDGGSPLAHCRLVSGSESDCPFRAPSEGFYVFEALADDAAPTQLTRYIGGRSGVDSDPSRSKERIALQPVEGAPGRVRLIQPHARARVLLLVERETVRAHHVAEVGPEAILDLPVEAGGDSAPMVAVRVFVRPADTADDDGFGSRTLSAVLRQPRTTQAPPPPTLSVERDVLAPGETLMLSVHNPGTASRAFTLAVVDDGMHQQATDLHQTQDPSGPHFLGERLRWRSAGLFATEAWTGSVSSRHLGLEKPAAATGSEQGGVVFDEPSPIQSPADFASGTLDTVEVVGSRITRAETFEVLKGAGRREGPAAGGAAAQARVRTRFVETAYWDTGLVLAAGESRTVRIDLPDNLTRWRVQAWASGEGVDFTRSELTVVATLPVEVRLGLPTHLYPGDRSESLVNARLASGEGRLLELSARADGAGGAAQAQRSARVAAGASLSVPVPMLPTASGEVTVLGQAQAGGQRDAVASTVPVPSRWAARRVTQLAWLTGEPLHLQSPLLPEGVAAPRLVLAVDDGMPGLRREWLDGLRDYPHVCWEQRLTRALGAAMALGSGEASARWPGAADVIEDVFAASTGFVDDEGHFMFFRHGQAAGEPMLSAYTLRAFGMLASLGHAPPAEATGELIATLSDFVSSEGKRLHEAGDVRPTAFEKEAWVLALAALAEAGEDVGSDELERAWAMWDDLSWHGRTQLAAALAVDEGLSMQAAQALARLREAGERDGARRIVRDPRDFSAMMGSSLRDQCAVAGTLLRLDPQSRLDGSAHALLRGIVDQYAGGAPGLDTQAALTCLLALRDLDAKKEKAADALAAIQVRAQGEALAWTDAPEGEGRRWEGPLPAGPIALDMPAAMPPLAMLRADASYQQDQATVTAAGTGMALRREYRVLRDGRWQPGVSPREGEWVQVVLRIRVPAWRNFVAITDAVPGGWTPRDTSLAGVGLAATARAGESDSYWFDARQSGTRHVRLYARHLPAGEHRVSYLAQATHAGDYLAPAAEAELMYGGGSYANTDAAKVKVLPAH